MATFAKQVKDELVLKEYETCCQQQILRAFIKSNGSMVLSNQTFSINAKTKSVKIATLIHHFFKEQYSIKPEVKVIKKMKLKKDNTYIISVSQNAREILKELDLQINCELGKQCCERAYIVGAFLATGSINSPKSSNYHLEIAVKDENQGQYILGLLEKYGVKAKMTSRRQEYVVYIKSAEMISDFLRVVEAHNSLMFYEQIRIERDFVNSLNRLENCEIANDVKSLEASNKQIAAIEKLLERYGLDHFNETTQEVIKIRLEHREKTLQELAELYVKKTGKSISKSGIYNQFNRLIKQAKQMDE